MHSHESAEIVIKGVTRAGKTFRPSDWAERLAGVFSSMGADHRMQYAAWVQPVFRSGLRCVVIRRELEKQAPEVYRFLLDFAAKNDLEVTEGRAKPRDA